MAILLNLVKKVRIHIGEGRETSECLHQGFGQQFVIDAGEACDNVFVVQCVVQFYETYHDVLFNYMTHTSKCCTII